MLGRSRVAITRGVGSWLGVTQEEFPILFMTVACLNGKWPKQRTVVSINVSRNLLNETAEYTVFYHQTVELRG